MHSAIFTPSQTPGNFKSRVRRMRKETIIAMCWKHVVNNNKPEKTTSLGSFGKAERELDLHYKNFQNNQLQEHWNPEVHLTGRRLDIPSLANLTSSRGNILRY